MLTKLIALLCAALALVACHEAHDVTGCALEEIEERVENS